MILRADLCVIIVGLLPRLLLAFTTNLPPTITHRHHLPYCQKETSRSSSSFFFRLYDIHQWRDLVFNYPGTGDDRRLGTEAGAPPREINILPFPYDQVLLQGETKQLRLYEDRFIELFENSMEAHCGTVGFGLLADSGIIQKMPLCEIEAYNRIDPFGIFVTIRVVGRAELVDFLQQEPYIKAVCIEVLDKVPPNLELPNLVARNIEDTLERVTIMERRLEQERNKDDDPGDKEEKDDEEMQSRIDRAQLEDRFYDEDSEDEDADQDRESRYKTAFKVALETDTQGYQVGPKDFSKFTPQELTAISWAAFCTDVSPRTSVTFRIQALDSENLLDRLKIGSQMLLQKEKVLKDTIVKKGLNKEKDEDEDSKDNT